MMLESTLVDRNEVALGLQEIENATGFKQHETPSEYAGIPRDYRQVSKNLGRVGALYAFSQTRLLAIKLMNDFCLRQLTSCQSWIPKGKWRKHKEVTNALVERTEYNSSHIQHMLIYQGLEMRLQTQQNVASTTILPKVIVNTYQAMPGIQPHSSRRQQNKHTTI
jgi:hypothetical protein